MKTLLACSLVSLLLVGCGGGGGGSSTPTSDPTPPPPQTNQSMGGIWTTSYTVNSGVNTGDTVRALAVSVDSGEYFTWGVNETNGCETLGYGKATVSGSAFTATGLAAVVTSAIPPVPSCVFPDGTYSGMGTASGTVVGQKTFAVTASSLTTTAGNTYSSSQPITYDFSSLYNAGSSLSSIAGNYSIDGNTVTVNADGSFSFPTNANGQGFSCGGNGFLSIVDSTKSVMSVSAAFKGCGSLLTGSNYNGLAFLNTSDSPGILHVFVEGTNAASEQIAYHFALAQLSPPTASPAVGVWTATPEAGMTATMVVAPNGQFYYETVLSNCVGMYTGTLIVNSSGSVFGTGWFVPSSSASCGVSTQAASFTGSVVAGQSMTLTSVGSGQFTINWTYSSSLSTQAASNAVIAGNWLRSSSGTVFSISSNGTFSETLSVNNCTVSGTYTPIAGYNAYNVTGTYAGCTGADSVLNGETGSGVATLDTRATPAALIGGVALMSTPNSGNLILVGVGDAQQMALAGVWSYNNGSGNQAVLIMDNTGNLTAFGLLNGSWIGYNGAVQISGSTGTGTVVYNANQGTCESCSDQIGGLQPTANVTVTLTNSSTITFADSTNSVNLPFTYLPSATAQPLTTLAAAQASWSTLQSGGEPSYPTYGGHGNPYPQANNFVCGTPPSGQAIGGVISSDVPALGIYVLTCADATYNSPTAQAAGLVFMNNSGQIFGAYSNQYVFTNVSYPAGVFP